MEASTNRGAHRGPEGLEVVGALGKSTYVHAQLSWDSPVTNYNLLARPHHSKSSIKALLINGFPQ